MINVNNITEQDSKIAVKNDLRDVFERFNPNLVKIEFLEVKRGFLANIKVTVYAKTFVVTSSTDVSPKAVDYIVFYVDIPEKYPAVGPKFYYAPDYMLASVNVYRTGTQCINTWGPGSSLLGAFEKTIRDIIHVPVVTKFNSMANSSLEEWQRALFNSGNAPTINPKLIFRDSIEMLQDQRANNATGARNIRSQMPSVGNNTNRINRPVVSNRSGLPGTANVSRVSRSGVSGTTQTSVSTVAGSGVTRPVAARSGVNRPVANARVNVVASGRVNRPSGN